MVREQVYRFTVPALSPLLDDFGRDPTSATYASVAIDPTRTLRAIAQERRGTSTTPMVSGRLF